jgi:hypothetical protein
MTIARAVPDDDFPPKTSGPLADPRRLRIEARLRSLVGPGPGDFFRDAYNLAEGATEWRTVTHLVGHCIREIESSVRAVLEPMSTGSASAPPKRKADSNHEEGIRAILAALEIPEDNPVAVKWFEQAGTYQGRAHRNNLAEPIPFDESARRFFEDFQGILDYVLERMEAKYERVVQALDQLAAVSPATTTDVDFLLQRCPQDFVARGRFFEKVTDPSWLGLLHARGLFSSPPEPELHDDNTVGFPQWPQVSYLVRMASVRPAEVIEIAAMIPASDNPVVNNGIVDIARALTPGGAVALLPRLVVAVDGRFKLGYLSRLATLIGTFEDAGDLASAENLLRAMVTFEPEPERTPVEEPDDEVGSAYARAHAEPRLRVDRHTFDALLERYAPRLVTEVGISILVLLADLLDSAIDASSAPSTRESGEDYSSVWRRTIVGDASFLDRGIKSELVSALRNAATRWLTEHPEALQDVLDMLKRYRWRVFRRLELDLLAEHPDAEPELALERLTDEAVLEDSEIRSELDRLRAVRLPTLSSADQLRILQSVDAEPTHLDVHTKWMQRAFGREVTEEEVATLAGTLRRDRLAHLSGHLPEPWATDYANLVATYGEAPSTERIETGGFYRARSPLTTEELGTLAIDELVDYINAFEPDGDLFGFSASGLAETLGTLVTAEPDRYLADARRLGELDSAYAHGVVTGVIAAMDRGTTLNWPGVVELCEAIVEHPRIINQDGSSGHDSAWTRLDVTRLLVRGFHSADPPPAILRERLIAVIARLADDPYPTPVDEELLGPPNGTFDNISMNSVRPRAIECAVELGIWIYKQDGADGLPDVLGLVADHLDPDSEPSRAVRVTIGSQFNNYVAFDHEWAAREAVRIFPPDEGHRDLWAAAWGAYLHRPLQYSQTFRVLREQYLFAITRMSPGSNDVAAQARDQTLGVHLMIAYWAGWIGLDDELIVGFFAGADEETRRSVIESVGRGLLQGEGALDDAIVARLFALLDARIEAERTAPSTELSAYGLWFASPKLPVDAALDRLRVVLEIVERVERVEPAHMIVERLAAISAEFPKEAAEILSAIVDRETDGWRFTLWDESAATILHAALASGEDAAADAAHIAASRAAARGHLAWLTFV